MSLSSLSVEELVDGAVAVALTLLSVALFVAALRLFRGPSLPDRVVALELIASVLTGTIAVYSIGAEQPIFLDVAIALSLVAFLGAVAFARYIEKGSLR
ncbi:MAG: cation:proton antiporter [Chloroflexi bacterium]|nr:cation:proton antiporter [Chloroflexota bacterium]